MAVADLPVALADFGYDVADFFAVDPRFGTLDDFDALVARAHELGLQGAAWTSCRATRRSSTRGSASTPTGTSGPRHAGPPNNWRASFGGPAWSRDPHGRGWYLHSFYPEQPDLDWRNPEVVAAMQDVVRFWLDRGVDGFRLDALDRLMKDPELRDDPPATGPPPLPAARRARRARARPLAQRARHRRRRSGRCARRPGDTLLVGEVYLPTAELGPYLEHLDRSSCFELFHAPLEPDALRARASAAAPRAGPPAWVLSNHDFPRLPSRVGAENVRAAALLLLTLPGCAFVYQGDELGVADGPGGPDRRWTAPAATRYRHPMQWDAAANGGFTDGTPWLPLRRPGRRNVAVQRATRGRCCTSTAA